MSSPEGPKFIKSLNSKYVILNYYHDITIGISNVIIVHFHIKSLVQNSCQYHFSSGLMEILNRSDLTETINRTRLCKSCPYLEQYLSVVSLFKILSIRSLFINMTYIPTFHDIIKWKIDNK